MFLDFRFRIICVYCLANEVWIPLTLVLASTIKSQFSCCFCSKYTHILIIVVAEVFNFSAFSYFQVQILIIIKFLFYSGDPEGVIIIKDYE
jgi:hypothetical protein